MNNPEDPAAGTRKVPFSRVLYIEQDDFRETPPPKYYRLAPGREVRLRYAYFVKCVDVVKDAQGTVVELRCTYDPATRGGDAAGRPQGEGHPPLGLGRPCGPRRGAPVRPALHSTRIRSDAAEGQDFIANLNPHSLEVLDGCWVEPSLAGAAVGGIYQFERQGYFCVDRDSRGGRLAFNRAVPLKDEWAKIERSQRKG